MRSHNAQPKVPYGVVTRGIVYNYRNTFSSNNLYFLPQRLIKVTKVLFRHDECTIARECVTHEYKYGMGVTVLLRVINPRIERLDMWVGKKKKDAGTTWTSKD